MSSLTNERRGNSLTRLAVSQPAYCSDVFDSGLIFLLDSSLPATMSRADAGECSASNAVTTKHIIQPEETSLAPLGHDVSPSRGRKAPSERF